MQVSMNGLRRQLSNNVDQLKQIVESVINDDDYDDDDLIEAMNDVITDSNVLNCVYNKDDSSFTDMGDLEIDHLESK